MEKKPTYTETLLELKGIIEGVEETSRRRDEVVYQVVEYLDKSKLPVVGILESQLDHLIESVGELKSTVREHRCEAREERDELRGQILEIGRDSHGLKQWTEDQDYKVAPLFKECVDKNSIRIKDIEGEMKAIWKTTKILPVFNGFMILAASLLTRLGIQVPLDMSK